MRNRFRSIGVAFALVASALPFWSAPPAGAGSATSFPVLNTRAGEFQPALEGSFLAWERNTRRNPNVYHIFARDGSGRPFKVNAAKTQGANGGIDGNLLAYQQFRGKSSNIKLYDLMERKRLEPPERVNTPKWEYWPSISESRLLFGRLAPSGGRKLILFNLTTGKTRRLDQTSAKGAFIQPGQVNGDYVVWSRCLPHRQCEVFRYRISDGTKVKIPNIGRFQRSPSVAADGTVYLVRSGRGCGDRATLLKYQGAFDVLVDLPNDADIRDTYVHTDEDGNTEVLYELNACDRPAGSDIWMIEESGSFSLSVSKIGDGSGRVTSDPEGINCGSDCSETYSKGAQVTLTAVPNSGSAFSGWGGACSGTAQTCLVAIDGVKNVTAAFDPPGSFTLNVTKTGGGDGTVTSDPTGINCGTECSKSFDGGTMVTLEADPAGGSSFTGWGGDCSGTSTCTVTMDGARSVTAGFSDANSELEVTRGGDGTGSVTSSPEGINCGTDCSEDYANGEDVTLTATPTGGSTFGGWEGDCADADGNTCVVEMAGDRSVIAFFNPPGGPTEFDLDVTIGGNGSVLSDDGLIDCGVDCSETYPSGETVELTATPANSSWAFDRWTGVGGACDASNVCNLTMTTDRSITAVFEPVWDLEVQLQGDGSGNVTSSPAGIDCPGECTASYSNGTEVTLTADPATGSSFEGWTGCNSEPNPETCIVEMDDDKVVTATFDDLFPSPERAAASTLWSSQGAGSGAVRAAASRTLSLGLKVGL